MASKQFDTKTHPAEWWSVSILAPLSVYLLIFMEWLFFSTKASFMSALGTTTKLSILLVAPLPLAAAVICMLTPILLMGHLCKLALLRRTWLAVGRLIPTVLLSTTGLLLIDNFTLTVFAFGIRSSSGIFRALYLILLAALSVAVYWKLSRVRQVRGIGTFTAALGILSLTVFIIRSEPARESLQGTLDSSARVNRPNILLLSSDALNARNLSIYGYTRETTPYLKEFSEQALVFENAFCNSGTTAASLVSVLTGKLPTTTQLNYPPDILRGHDSYQHLPWILRNYGYRSIQLSVRHYADAYDSNLLMSFDAANFRKRTGSEPSRVLASFVGLDTAYFLAQTRDRVKARLLHLLFRERIENVYEMVTAREGPYKQDITLLQELFSFLQEIGDTPFLAQVHLMGTHGARYRPRHRVFSHGKEQTEPYMVDFYDDSILDFDRYAQDVIAALRDQDKLDNTLIVIYSDHGQIYKTDERIPLIIRLPREERRGRVSVNVQAIDIAPTILDYMRGRIPDWMEGRSLFTSALSPLESMISTGPAGSAVYSEEGLLKIDTTRAGPPFYSLGSLRFTICHKSFALDLERNLMMVSRIRGHTSPCDEDSIPAAGDMETRMLSHLRSNGYEIPPERPPATVQVLD